MKCQPLDVEGGTLVRCSVGRIQSGGFSLVEFLIASLVFLAISGALFEVLGRIQRSASYQAEILGVLENTRIALETVERIVQQAGNDPRGFGFKSIVIVSATEVRVLSDLTGSAAPAFPDKGDPDGDLSDSYEDVTISYNASSQALELATGDGSAQPVANSISAFRIDYFDGQGAATVRGDEVCRMRITVTGTSTLPDPVTGIPFSMELSCDIRLAARN
jgi:Tfp pilus assembly protein PilW